jgi:D-ribose pyranase
MLRQGILNPQVLSLLARTRHTNTVLIADRGFPYWPELETIDLSLVAMSPPYSNIILESA